jgi:hypothetical protein
MDLYTYSPHAFPALTKTTLHYRILVMSVINYVAAYWVRFNGNILFGMSGVIHLFPRTFMA